MSLALKNKEIRKELEHLTEEVRALSAIYWRLQESTSEDQQNKIKSNARRFVYSTFSQYEIDSFYKRKTNLAFKSPLESVSLEIVKPEVKNA
jgi:hypothetical protein